LVQAVQDLEQLLVCLSKALKLLVSLNYFLQGQILCKQRVELMQLLEASIMMTGDGISMIQLKVVIGLETKTLFNI